MCLGGPIQSACKIKPVKRAHLVVLQNTISELVIKMLFLVNPPL